MLLAFQASDDKRWKCETCLLRMDEKLLKCQACESWRPGLSEAEKAAAQAAEEQRMQSARAIFTGKSSNTVKSTGFSGFGATGAGGSSIAFGSAPAGAGGSSIAFGSAPAGAGGSSIAFGSAPAGSGGSSIAFGSAPASSGGSSIAFGSAPASSGGSSIAFGSAPGATMFGSDASSSSSMTFGFGGSAPSSAFGSTGSKPAFGFGGEAASGSTSADKANNSASSITAGFGNSLFGNSSSSGAIVFGGDSIGSSATAPGAFSFGNPSSSSAIGAGTFGFGTSASAPAAPASVGFSFGSSAPLGSNAGEVSFGSGFKIKLTPDKPPSQQVKVLEKLPDFTCQNIPVGDVFVHGSGECDQLGLGDAQRERQKPTLVQGLTIKQICDVVVGSLHVLCLSAQGQVFSWGCNDDGALGRPTGDEDCEPRLAALPPGVAIQTISCGDNHSCALDNLGRVWLWGTYKDSNGHIGIARKRKQTEVLEKSAEPAVVLESCIAITSGANHTVAVKSSARSKAQVFAWGSNGTGQLGLKGGPGCGLEERVISSASARSKLKAREGGGVEVDGLNVIRCIESSGLEQSATNMKVPAVEQSITLGATALVLEIPEREVPKKEKQNLLFPQEVYLGEVDGSVVGAYASAECTFLTTTSGQTYGCGLNGDGQVGLGFASMAVLSMRQVTKVNNATWLGGGLHMSAALIDGKVWTWGKADECGHGIGPGKPPLMEPRVIADLPKVRTLRCGNNHTLACTEGGDGFVWGCGLTHQLANRPRNYLQPEDKDDDPEDELRPYRISSKQLEKRFVLLADGGAQHSVELAWNGQQCPLTVADDVPAPVAEVLDDDEPPWKKAKPQPESDSRIKEGRTPDISQEASATVVGIPAARIIVDTGREDAPVFAGLPAPAVEAPTGFTNMFFNMPKDDRWRCEGCNLRWDQKLIKCKACESYKPGMSEADIAKAQAEEEKQKNAAIAIFQPSGGASTSGFGASSAPQATGFSFGASGGTTAAIAFGSSPAPQAKGITFGASGASAGGVTFGSSPTPPTASFAFGQGGVTSESSSAGTGAITFGSGAASQSSSTLVFGANASSSPFTSAASAAPSKEKELSTLPDVECSTVQTFKFELSESLGISFNKDLVVGKEAAQDSQAARVGICKGWRALTADGQALKTPKELVSKIKALKANGSKQVEIEFEIRSNAAPAPQGPEATAPPKASGTVEESVVPQTSSPPSLGFSFGASASTPATSSITFGSGAGGFTFTPPPSEPSFKAKELAVLPDWSRSDVAVGDVFVHGSGECDQLGLGDNQRERQKPTIVRGLSGIQICDIAVGALHVLCLTAQGRIYSWGCNDDGALGRKADDTSDCEPHFATLPTGVIARKVSCGDCHSCALDNLGRVWLWGTYKDSNGHIGIAQKRKQDSIFEKSAEPTVLLEGCTEVVSGANHTVALALARGSRDRAVVFSWGSNGTGQLGLQSEAGCGLSERISPVSEVASKIKARDDGAAEVEGMRLIRYKKVSGEEVDAMSMKADEVIRVLGAGASDVVLEVPEREVPKAEKKALLFPQEMDLSAIVGNVNHVYTSQEGTFVTVMDGSTYGCGLNGDGQVGLGFASMAVTTLRFVPGVANAAWLGGGLQTSAALIQGKIFTWGKAEECGHGLGAGTAPLFQPREVRGMPEIRSLRCSAHHMLACSKGGDVFVWGCGLTHQLANRPRDILNRKDVDEDPDDELKPYCVSSKQLADRYVLLADGGAQHSVELAWSGKYEQLTECASGEVPPELTNEVQQGPPKHPDVPEPVSKKARATDSGLTFGASAVSPGGITFGAAPAVSTTPTPTPLSFSFGSSTSSKGAGVGGFSFGAEPLAAISTTPPPAAFSFGTATSAAGSGSITFGSGAGGFTFTPAATTTVAKEKSLSTLPDFLHAAAPVGEVFVHGSGECDQLGLGDNQRERKKPTIVRGLSGIKIHDIAVGALHVLCLTVQGQIYSWGCNDDGALGRPTDDSDCEPRLALLPTGILVRKASCGDCHSCALDSLGRVWLWGTYKDSNGHIGTARKRKQDPVFEKSAEPVVVLEGCSQISSGANHTVALAPTPQRPAGAIVFSWGSNGTGQLGLENKAGCGLGEREVPASQATPKLQKREGGGTEVDGLRVVRFIDRSGTHTEAANMTLADVERALMAGAQAVVLEIPEREVPKAEKQALLHPQEMHLQEVNGRVTGVHTSKECTFVTVAEGGVYGCGLNGDGQVGLCFASMAVPTLRSLYGVAGATWLGGGLHASAALVDGQVFTWGKAEECGHGLGAGIAPILKPRAIEGLPRIRTLRCGGHHMLACSAAGDVFVWGCGLTYQLANRPRVFSTPTDVSLDPEDELKPYCISSKQLESRFVLLADGGAQHSVELAWNGEYENLPDIALQVDNTSQAAPALASNDEQPVAKRARTLGDSEAVLDGLAKTHAEHNAEAAAAAAEEERLGHALAEAEVGEFFQGGLYSEYDTTVTAKLLGGKTQAARTAFSALPAETYSKPRVLWSSRLAAANSTKEVVDSTPAHATPVKLGLQLPLLPRIPAEEIRVPDVDPRELRMRAQLASCHRAELEETMLELAQRDETVLHRISRGSRRNDDQPPDVGEAQA